jgi:hypothetical protein
MGLNCNDMNTNAKDMDKRINDNEAPRDFEGVDHGSRRHIVAGVGLVYLCAADRSAG